MLLGGIHRTDIECSIVHWRGKRMGSRRQRRGGIFLILGRSAICLYFGNFFSLVVFFSCFAAFGFCSQTEGGRKWDWFLFCFIFVELFYS